MNWLEIAVHVCPEGIDMVSNIFDELGAGGVVIEDPALINRYIEANIWDHYEFPPEVLNRPQPIVKAYLPEGPNLENKLVLLQERLTGLPLDAVPTFERRQVAEEDWATAWMKYYKPVEIGQKLAVKPSWEDYVPEDGRIVLEMDPGMAFGCGNHPTTTMCMEYLEGIIQGGESVADVGTGTGILAITSAKLGAARVLAVDLDEVAVKVSQENVERNGVQDIVEVFHGNLLDKVESKVDVVIANIVANVIMILAPDVPRILKHGGYFITSGIIQFRAEEVRQKLEQTGFKILGRKEDGEWVSYLCILEG
ncbi:[LSU ribosomal protein L11P]-lysine N-methyltransferase [Desulforamulus reducens MI-1]|uniref:Ribosomal protein L11 methyltransferase n=1 Tax=Desulforamulus reducens (strain ATCC BAA-1160 / DSM 100696 / MI-1) TaxID=349161 RepID=PRMA_DESRM|nr:50S ribosomal protein L11 methyltransferase [Desulforamulus reducens]A4J7F1.1 RecName: Full=Ribosomal protein L11 methyltransferase; Short=L11 Mtase [Desulforamulus reducens MI-1]ABO51004.1 [LSU ribosomal protein L11P]-lysine N-methyltransferase [Desulforamulus reducens MI-1]